MNGQRKNRIDPDKLGLWECCGMLNSPNCNCRICGRSAKDSADISQCENIKPEQTEAGTLVKVLKTSKGIFPDTAKLRIIIVRGCGTIPLDHDNLVGGCKPLRDAIAEILGRDDAEHRGTEWIYRQEKGAATRIEIQEIKEV